MRDRKFLRLIVGAGLALVMMNGASNILAAASATSPVMPDGVEVFYVDSVGFVLATSPDGSDVELVKFCPGECNDACIEPILTEVDPWPTPSDNPGPTPSDNPGPTPSDNPKPTSTKAASTKTPSVATSTPSDVKVTQTPTRAKPGTKVPQPTSVTLVPTLTRPASTWTPRPEPSPTAIQESNPLEPCGEGKVRICKAGHSKSQCVSESSLKGRQDDYSRGACPGE